MSADTRRCRQPLCGCPVWSAPAPDRVGAEPNSVNFATALGGLRAGVLALVARARSRGHQLRPWTLDDGGEYVIAGYGTEMSGTPYGPRPAVWGLQDWLVHGRFGCVHDDFADQPLLLDDGGVPTLTLGVDTAVLLPRTEGLLALLRVSPHGASEVLVTGGWAPGATTPDQIRAVTAMVLARNGAQSIAELASWARAAEAATATV